MKKVYLVTLCTCLVVIAFVSASVYFLRDEEKEITVGFVYVGDASTAYTSNFIDAQEAIQTKYRDQVKVIALNNETKVQTQTHSPYIPDSDHRYRPDHPDLPRHNLHGTHPVSPA